MTTYTTQQTWFWANFGREARKSPGTVQSKIDAVRAVRTAIGGPEVLLRKAAQRMADMTKVPGSEADALQYAERITKAQPERDRGRGIPCGPSVFEVTAEGLAAESAATRRTP